MQGHNILPRRYVGGGIAARFIIFQPTYYKKRYVEDLIGASVVNESLRIKIQSTIKRHVYKAAFARRGKLLAGNLKNRVRNPGSKLDTCVIIIILTRWSSSRISTGRASTGTRVSPANPTEYPNSSPNCGGANSGKSRNCRVQSRLAFSRSWQKEGREDTLANSLSRATASEIANVQVSRAWGLDEIDRSIGHASRFPTFVCLLLLHFDKGNYRFPLLCIRVCIALGSAYITNRYTGNCIIAAKHLSLEKLLRTNDRINFEFRNYR